MSLRTWQLTFVILLTCGASLGKIQAQSSLATLLGTVRDESDAILQAVDIEVREESTGLARNTVSGSKGAFVLPLLPPGHYTLTASLVGFKKAVVQGITLRVSEKVNLD